MNVNHAINIDDLRKMAKRRLPRIIYDFIEGGVEDELGIARNEAAYDRERLVPHYLVDVSKRDQTGRFACDRRYSSPFGISATGLAALFRPGADLMLAESAAQANIPFMMCRTEHRVDRSRGQGRAESLVVSTICRARS